METEKTKAQEIKKPLSDEEYMKAITKNLNSLNNGWSDVPPVMKGIIVVGSGVIVIWASGYAFSALARAIRGFKELQRSIREK